MMAAMEIVSARAALEGVEITALLADAGYDASALYGFAQRLGMHPIIALRAPILVPKDVPRDEHGRPLCPGGCVMRCHGQQGSRVVFNCPIRRPNHKGEVVDHIDECPLGKLCEPGTKMGPYYRLEVSDSPKANLKIYPETERWKALYKERTAVERLFSRLKTTGKLGSRPYRRMHVFHFVTVCQSMVMHLRAWAKQLGGLVKPKTVVELRALVARLRGGAMRSA
jgi:transposase